jgi:hypothetical protein
MCSATVRRISLPMGYTSPNHFLGTPNPRAISSFNIRLVPRGVEIKLPGMNGIALYSLRGRSVRPDPQATSVLESGL